MDDNKVVVDALGSCLSWEGRHSKQLLVAHVHGSHPCLVIATVDLGCEVNDVSVVLQADDWLEHAKIPLEIQVVWDLETRGGIPDAGVLAPADHVVIAR